MKNIFRSIVLLFIAFTLLGSCKKMTSTYKQFVVPGGLTYPGIPGYVTANSGHNRVVISWLRNNDPNVVETRVFWNNYTDSAVIRSTSTINEDTIRYVINNLPEKHYDFLIKTYDENGNTSMPIEVLSTAYGDNYLSGLANRTILSSVRYPQGQVVINWGGAATSIGAFMTEMQYTDTTGGLRTKYIGVNEFEDTIRDYMPHTTFQYRTFYLPDSLCIDTFFTAFREVQNEELLDNAGIRGITLPTDAPVLSGNNGLDKLFDGIWNGGSPYASQDNIPLPQWITIDLGEKISLTRLKFFQWASPDRVYSSSNARSFQIWGSNAPDLTTGSWENWQQLGATFNQYKPSGLPEGQHTDQDIDYAIVNGEEFKFPPDMPAVRYIRFKTIATYSMTGQVAIQEIQFLGHVAP